MVIKRALVVDDSKAAGLALLKMLEQHQVAVDLADSAEAALAYLRNQRPDVIFMDHIMPGMNGLEAAKTITADPHTAMIPIVMYTSTEGPSYPEKAKAHGAVGVLPKPPKPTLLAQFIHQLSGVRDADMPKPRVVPPAPAPAGPTPTASTEAFDSIARRVAESVVQNGVQSLVTRLVDEQLAQLRDDTLARCETVAKQAAAQVQHARTAELVNLLRKQIQDQLAAMSARLDEAPGAPVPLDEIKGIAKSVAIQEATDTATRAAHAAAQHVAQEVAIRTAGSTARQVAADVYDARASVLAEELRRHFQNELAIINARLTEPPTVPLVVVEELRHMLMTAAAREAVEAATQTAHTVAHRAALDVAEQAVAATRQAADELCTTRIAMLGQQLRKDVADQLGEITSPQAGQANIPPATLAEIKNVARFVASQKAGELAQRAVQEVARETGQEIAKQATQTAVRQVERALDIALQTQMRRTYLLAGTSAAVGVLAAVAAFCLR